MKPKLNKITQSLRPTGDEPQVIYGFDRITLWIDIAEFPLSENIVKEHCTKIKVTPMQMPHNARWKLRIEVFQPTQRCLRLLKEALGHDIAVLVSYVEIAFDVPATSAEQALLRRNYFLASAKMRYQHHPVVLDKHGTVFYFGRRTKVKKGRTVRFGHVMAAYSDKPSKILDARPADGSTPCTHIEHRASGSAVMADVGIIGLDDLLDFDHPAFWERHIYLYQLPPRKTIGYQLAKASGAYLEISDAAFRKRAANWVSDNSIEDAYGSNFIMHNALREARELCKAFPKISFLEWLDEVLWL